ncbi:hypothetical protein HS125_17180 [bacterium]|nr:hypothetical protein [bacterium]
MRPAAGQTWVGATPKTERLVVRVTRLHDSRAYFDRLDVRAFGRMDLEVA